MRLYPGQPPSPLSLVTSACVRRVSVRRGLSRGYGSQVDDALLEGSACCGPLSRGGSRRLGGSRWPPRRRFALKGLLVERALAGDHERRRSHQGVEADRVEDVEGRRRSVRRRRPRPPDSPPAQPVINHRADRAGSLPRARRGAARAAQPSPLRPPSAARDARASSNGTRTSHTTWARGLAGLNRPPSMPRVHPRRRPGRCGGPPTVTTIGAAPARRRTAISSPVPRVDAAHASRSSSATSDRPLAWAISTTPEPSGSTRESRLHGPAERVETVAVTSPPSADTSTSMVPSPPSATGSSRVSRPASRNPSAIAWATSAAEFP